MVGAIHGRLLTAWATAGILGPVVVNYMRDYQLSIGLPRAQVYNQTMYILTGMLLVGLICNLMIRPVDDKWFMTDAELAEVSAAKREAMKLRKKMILNKIKQSKIATKIAKGLKPEFDSQRITIPAADLTTGARGETGLIAIDDIKDYNAPPENTFTFSNASGKRVKGCQIYKGDVNVPIPTRLANGDVIVKSGGGSTVVCPPNQY
jgi:hypothetical protein